MSIKTWLSDKAENFAVKTGIAYLGDPLVFAMNDRETTLEIPGYRQTQLYTCGFVAGLMVLHTFKPKASADRFYAKVDPDPEWGIETGPLARALRRSGIGVRIRHDLTFSEICGSIEDGYHIISTVRQGGPDDLHWIVVYGCGRSPNVVFVAGNGLPYLGKKKVAWSDFARLWSPRGNGLVCWGK